MFLKKWKERIYNNAFQEGKHDGISRGYKDGLKIGYERGFADASKGGIMINEYGVFICKDKDNIQSMLSKYDFK